MPCHTYGVLSCNPYSSLKKEKKSNKARTSDNSAQAGTSQRCSVFINFVKTEE